MLASDDLAVALLDVTLFGTDAGAYHVTNLVLHMASSILVFELFRRMTGETALIAFVAAVFAAHPLHVESVAWIAERKDVLSTFFWMLTVLAYVVYVRRPAWTRYGAMLILYALALMSKPMVVTLPVVLLLGRLAARRDQRWRLLLERFPCWRWRQPRDGDHSGVGATAGLDAAVAEGRQRDHRPRRLPLKTVADAPGGAHPLFTISPSRVAGAALCPPCGSRHRGPQTASIPTVVMVVVSVTIAPVIGCCRR